MEDYMRDYMKNTIKGKLEKANEKELRCIYFYVQSLVKDGSGEPGSQKGEK